MHESKGQHIGKSLLISVTVRPKPKKNISSVTTTPELETALTVVPGM